MSESEEEKRTEEIIDFEEENIGVELFSKMNEVKRDVLFDLDDFENFIFITEEKRYKFNREKFIEKFCLEEIKRCQFCGMDLSEHDGSGFCPPGTEEFGGKR